MPSWRTEAPAPRRRSRGFALLIVLWTLVLLSLLATSITAGGRGEAQIAANLRQQASIAAAADGIVYEALFHLMDTSGTHWPANGQRHRVALAGGTAEVTLVSEAGRFGLNHASQQQLQALLQQLGAAPGTVQGLAAAIVAWRTPDQDGQAARQYRSAGMAYGPPGAPFQSLAEMRLVLGMTPKLFADLLPHLSLGQTQDPDQAVADAVVRRALQAAASLPAPPPPAPPAAPAAGAPAPAAQAPAAAAAPPGLPVQVICTAVDLSGTSFTRRAEVLVAPDGAADVPPVRILDWSAG
jgi:general secretion pathway protein K